MPAGSLITAYIGAKEGKVLKAYRDPVHIITIGYGATWASSSFRKWYAANRGAGKLKMGDTVSQREALDILKLMLNEEYAPPVDQAFALQPQRIKDGAYSMALNAGPGALQWNWAKQIMAGDIVGGIRRWRTTATTAKGKKLPGLVIRRNEEADLAETGRYPSWFKANTAGVPETHTVAPDIRQAQVWLEKLGYAPGPADGVPGPRTVEAVKRFQRDHGQLSVDGIIGPATLAALQRTIDLRNKAGGVAGTGVGGVAGGATEGVTGAGDGVSVPDTPVTSSGDLGWIGDALLWGGVAVLVVGAIWLAWRYRDEINSVLRRLA